MFTTPVTLDVNVTLWPKLEELTEDATVGVAAALLTVCVIAGLVETA
jgi:hypothetical protein